MEPPGLASAPPLERLDYWRELAKIAWGIKREEIKRGIDKAGRKLKPVKPRSRPDGAGGPPLIPHEEASRTYRLLATHADVDGATLFWRGHGRKSWATILGYHAYRHGPRALPVRNTIGISLKGRNQVKREAFAWWSTHQGAKGGATPKVPAKGAGRVVYTGKYDPKLYGKIQVVTGGGKPGAETPKPKPRTPKVVADARERARLAAEAEAKAKREEAQRKRLAKEARARAMAAEEARLLAERLRQEAEWEAARKQAEAERLAKAAALAREAAAGAGRGATVTQADLANLRARIEAEQRPSRKNAVAAEWAMARMSPTASPVQKHGMTAAEEMHALTVDGITYRFPAVDRTDVERVGQIGATFRNAVNSVGEIPPELQKHTREIVLSSGANKNDPYWKIAYKNPHHVSNATGGDGDIVVYNKGAATTDTLAHEMGHNLAGARYGSVNVRPSSDFADAARSAEPPVSDYARNSLAEDFAEAVRMYVLEPDRLQSIAPRRYAIVRRMIEESTYGG